MRVVPDFRWNKLEPIVRNYPEAVAWVVDNYSFLNAQARETREALSRSFYRKVQRTYGLASEFIAHSAPELDLEYLRVFFEKAQREQPLTLAELWAIRPMLRLVLLEKLITDPSQAGNVVTALKVLDEVAWPKVIESLCVLEPILRQDPAGTYAEMDFDTRDHYRRAVERIARQSRRSEPDVARLVLEVALEAARANTVEDRRAHIGYYLIGDGVRTLEQRAGSRTPVRDFVRRTIYSWPNLFYLGGIAFVTAALLTAIHRFVAPAPWWMLLAIAVPASQAAVSVMNALMHRYAPPRRLPRLDFSKGIPDRCRTFVVVPTLLLSRAVVEKLLEKLEIHYLANRDPNLLFALLTDGADADSQRNEQDELAEMCAEGIRRLNRRYASTARRPFYLFHRGRKWNESESVWMGYERKRGKLNDFNTLLMGGPDAFELKVGDLSIVSTVRYVITLDTDTQLPRDTARELVAALSHPLNRAVFDDRTNLVREGYAILQPRISISMESAGRSLLARFYSGQTGLDPYTTAVSDVYQDLYQQATFTGKGIYDLVAFHRSTQGRFPENTLLSHDLIEGEHARVGLVSDLELIDDYPTTYEAYSKRKHRWVRGDWQILFWLLPRVPDETWRWTPNPLSWLSRWKILDNLRRSGLEISLIAALACTPGYVVFALLLLPAYFELLLGMLRLPPLRFWRSYAWAQASAFARAHLDALLTLVFALHQAILMGDAVVRTLVRRFITKRKLLEWESMAQAEAGTGNRLSLANIYLFATPVVALIFALSAGQPAIALLWVLSPLLTEWLNSYPGRWSRKESGESAFLRDVSLRTWRYYVELSTPEGNWLVPDNIQEEPEAVAWRTSPTNIGLQLNAILAAHDFGYLSNDELVNGLWRVLDSTQRMEHWRGHLYNWYDIRSLQPLDPRYVSAVDSGNLAASLLVTRQGSLDVLKQPVLGPQLLAGLRDHCLCVRDALPPYQRTGTTMRLISSILRQLEDEPSDLFYWKGLLKEVSSLFRRLSEYVDPPYWGRAMNQRIEAALAQLQAIAPWLRDPCEAELRTCSTNGSFTEVMQALCAIPAVSELPRQYEIIQDCILRRLESSEPLRASTRATLEGLLCEIRDAKAAAMAFNRRIEEVASDAARMALEIDFACLFDEKRKLLRIGHDVRNNQPDEHYYDLLASEARTAVFFGIAKGDLPREAWFHLGRKLTFFRSERTLLSYSGTMFEYLMPCLFMRPYPDTLLGASLRGAVRIHRLYARERNVPWGISEAAHSGRDSAMSYQYKAFGVPALGMKRLQADEVVVAPYASVLALMVDRAAAADNLRLMASKGWMGRFGFFESVDYRPRRVRGAHRFTVVRAFMAHHQGMSMVALCNAVLGNKMQERFHAEPLVLATELLLQERVPALIGALDEEHLPALPAAPEPAFETGASEVGAALS